ncbi:acid protease [Polyplosphaeria fusca]|uniref:Acid protease n=1 Tax=Polyplosphaeria fusca TaxID=682080 RepID=A0A9P4UWA3_9PLEO|nr:acid protease [Polyplosphaeria fusca]
MASLLYLSAIVLFVQSTVAFNCSRPPIYVDIHKRAVHGSDAFQYGSFIGVGTPAQNQSLWPSISQNHTSFAASTYCNNSTLKNCATSTGGLFDFSESSSFQEQDDYQTKDANRNGTFKGIYGTDDIHLYTHYFETDGATQNLVSNTTIEVAESGSITPAIVGMGQASTLLDTLAARDMIAGRTYSLYIGQGFDRAGGAVNGSNTFGGYDSGRFTGDVHRYPMSLNRRNPMAVKVKDIVLSSDSKSNTSLFDSSKFPDTKTTSFDAEITTDQFPLSLPYDVTQNFMKQLNAQEDNTWGDNSLKAASGPSADKPLSLTIVLEDGFTVTIPPEVLINASNITPIQKRDADDTRPYYLSAAFLGQVYLMADYESYSFYLAEAVQKNAPVMPVSFCPKSTPAPYEYPKQNAWVRQGLIGAVIGGIFGGIGIAITAWCFILGCRRRRDEKRLERELEKGRRAKMGQMEVEDVPEFDPPPKSATPFFWKKR